MRIPILSARVGWHTDELVRALGARGHQTTVLPYERLVARFGTAGSLTSLEADLLGADAVLARIVPGGSLEQIIYRIDALHWLEVRGVRVMNTPAAIERTVDKFYTTALLHTAGLPTPDTVVCETIDQAMAAVRALGDVVIKPLFGSMGHGLVRVSDPEVAFRVLKSLDITRAVFYVQRAVDHGGRDLRAFVVGGKVIGAIERHARDGDWRTNVSRGGVAVPCELPEAWKELAIRAAAVVGADYAGVDLLPVGNGVLVVEINGIPGWQGLQRATGLDVAGAIVDHLIATVHRGVAAVVERA
jgi:RimK family alpha-L-glutamate ligase